MRRPSLHVLSLLITAAAFAYAACVAPAAEAQGARGITDLMGYADEEGNRIPDFSYAGWRNGKTAPETDEIVRDFGLAAERVVRVAEGEGEDHVRIQAAINQVCERSLLTATRNRDRYRKPSYLPESRYRGVVDLAPGTYHLYEELAVPCSGVLVTGAGAGQEIGKARTVLRRHGGTTKSLVLRVGPAAYNGWGRQDDSRSVAVTTHVPVGSLFIPLRNAQQTFSVGDAVIVYDPCSSAWIARRNGGGVHQRGTDDGVPYAEWACEDVPGARNPLDNKYHRYVQEVTEGGVVLDAPVYDHVGMPRDSAETAVYPYRSGEACVGACERVNRDVVVSGLRIEIQFDRSDVAPAMIGNESLGHDLYVDTSHTGTGVKLWNVEHAVLHDLFVSGFSTVAVWTDHVTRSTIRQVTAAYPAAPIGGGWRYHFSMGGGTQLVLIQDAKAWHGRHSFVANGGRTTSGNVVLRGSTLESYDTSEGHQRWSHGVLYDQFSARQSHKPTVIGMYNRHSWGGSATQAGHGYGAANYVLWNSDLGGGTVRVQKPPFAQNYVVGLRNGRLDCGSNPEGNPGWAPCEMGFVQQEAPVPSLYEYQRNARRP